METKSKKNLWQSLAEQNLPDDREIYDLSGMLSDDITRFSEAWARIPKQLQLSLVSKLKDITEVDFAVDFSAVFNIALDSPHPDICITAIDGLAENEDIRLMQRFIDLLEYNRSSAARAAAAQALDTFVALGEFEKMKQLFFERALNALTNVLENPSENADVKRRALESLAYASLDNITSFITKAYFSENEKMKISAVFAMGRNADKQWADTVLKELKNTNPEMRFEATRACGEMQLQDAVTDLVELTDDTDSQIQETALWALGQIGGKQARRVLVNFIDSENEALSSAAQQAVDELDFFQNGISSFIGPPSEFNGEGDSNWLNPDGNFGEEFDFDMESEENLWDLDQEDTE